MSWTIPIDVIERYQMFLEDSKSQPSSSYVYNCSYFRFGSRCQYFFDREGSFQDIVEEMFAFRKDRLPSRITLNTCYTHINCIRGSSLFCLDWREICDGKTDCLNGADELQHCFDLEMNDCSSSEYCCLNGMYIPADFFLDMKEYPDCLDGTDEVICIWGFNDFGELGCQLDPSFRCEEIACERSLAYFACGDRQCVYSSIPAEEVLCWNRRDALSTAEWLRVAIDNSLSSDCRLAMLCHTGLATTAGFRCKSICYDGRWDSCGEVISETCPPLFFFLLNIILLY